MSSACHRINKTRSLSHYLTHSAPLSRTTRLVGETQRIARNPRRFFANSKYPDNHVVVLGGGITGLATAFHLSRRIPQIKITLVENQDRVGGWMRSERVELGAGKGHVVLEAGPRTLRPRSQALLELVRPHSHCYGTTSNLSNRSTSLTSNPT